MRCSLYDFMTALAEVFELVKAVDGWNCSMMTYVATLCVWDVFAVC